MRVELAIGSWGVREAATERMAVCAGERGWFRYFDAAGPSGVATARFAPAAFIKLRTIRFTGLNWTSRARFPRVAERKANPAENVLVLN